MPMYRTRLVQIEAVQFKGDLAPVVDAFSDLAIRVTGANEIQIHDVLHDSWINLAPGDWVIRGTEGEYYPCADQVFTKKYEEVW